MVSHARFRIPALAATPVLLLAASAAALLGTSTAKAGAVQCTYTPVLPKLVVVNAPIVSLHTPVKITAATGVDCRTDFSASERLVHGSDVHNIAWQYNSTTAANSIYATTVIPGTYTMSTQGRLCGVTLPTDSSKHPTCAVGSGSTVFKFGGKASLSGTRLTGSKKSEIRFTARAGHYNQYSASYISTKVAIQRYYSRAWHTIHLATTVGSHGYAFTYTDAHAAYYRAVSSTTSTVVGAVSAKIVR